MARGNTAALTETMTVTNTALDALSEFSISFWVNIAAVVSSGAILSRTGFSITFTNAVSSSYTMTITGTASTRVTGAVFPNSTWINVIIVKTASTMVVYLNGTSVEFTTSVGSVPATFGSGQLTFFGAKRGSLAEIGIWSGILTATEIDQLSRKRYSPALVTTSLVGAWRLLGEDPEPDSSVFAADIDPGNTVVTEDPTNIYGSIPLVLLAPHFISPLPNAIFNRGTVSLEWTKNDPPSLSEDVDTDYVTYELEYTDDYEADKTLWRTFQRRIPWSTTSYEWMVGKMIKSKNVRVRIRAKDVLNETASDWSISESFSVGVFDLIAPIIVSPVENKVYSEFVMIVWDETLIKDTFHQKVRYTIEYSSETLQVDWTIIAANVPIGQNIVRWDVSNVLSAEDYVIRLKARDVSTTSAPTYTETASCQEIVNVPADQFAVRYVYNIRIRHSGLFIIDTVPPVARIQIEGNSTHVSNQKKHILNIFADDATTQVETIRLANCDASSYLPLGALSSIAEQTEDCDLQLLLESEEIPYSQKISYELSANESGFRKIQALLSDTGGNLSIHKPSRLFFPFFEDETEIADFVIYQKTQDTYTMEDATAGGVTYPTISTVSETYELMCIITTAGQVWILDPYPRLAHELDETASRVFYYSGALYFFTHSVVNDGSGGLTDLTQVWRESGSTVILISPVKSDSNPTNHFQKDYAICSAVVEFDDDMIVGFENGELWRYDGVTWTLITTFTNSIKSLSSDSKFLYIGFENSSDIKLYNGTTFYSVAI